MQNYQNDASYQKDKRLYVLANRDHVGANRVTADSHRRYFVPRVKIENTTLKLTEENFMISELIT